MTVRLALTGTPGTGKTTVAHSLASRGLVVVDLGELADDCGCVTGFDDGRGSKIVDEVALGDAFETVAGQIEDAGFVALAEGHFAHEMPVDVVVVLRTEPSRLAERLRARGWPEPKVRENAEAEAMGVIAAEALRRHHATRVAAAYEVDTTGADLGATAEAVLACLAAEGGRPDPGRFDVGLLPWV